MSYSPSHYLYEGLRVRSNEFMKEHFKDLKQEAGIELISSGLVLTKMSIPCSLIHVVTQFQDS